MNQLMHNADSPSTCPCCILSPVLWGIMSHDQLTAIKLEICKPSNRSKGQKGKDVSAAYSII